MQVTPVLVHDLRVPLGLFAALFGAFALLLFIKWWQNLPLFPYMAQVIQIYWERDSGKLLPVLPVFLFTWARNGVAALLLVVFELSSWQAGRRALSWTCGREVGKPWRALFSIGLGNGILGTLVLGFGFMGLLDARILAMVLAIPPVCWATGGFARRPAAGSPAGQAVFRPHLPKLDAVEWCLAGFCAFIAVYNLLPAFEPEWFYDSLVYHLGVPSRWLVGHRIVHLPDNFISSYPFLQEMQYLFFLALGQDIGARLLHWLNGAGCMVAAYAIAFPLLGRRGALLAAAVFASMPPLRFLQHVAMVELGLSWLVVLAMAAFMRATGITPGKTRIPLRAWLFLSAWFLGMAQGSKYFAVFVSAILILKLALDTAGGNAPLKRTAADIALLVAWGAAWTAPWLLKNWLFTGNPVFPMLGGIFPSSGWDASLNSRWMADNMKYGTGHGVVLNWLAMPVMASVGTADFGTFSLNPFILLFLPVLVFLRNVPSPVRFMAGVTGAYFVLWALSSQQTRFLMPVVPAASVAVAYVITRGFAGRRLLALLARGAAAWILVDCVFGQIQNRFTNNNLVPYCSGRLDPTGFLYTGVQYYRTAEAANSLVPDSGKILFLGGDESYYFRKPLVCASIYDRSYAGELAQKASSPAGLRALMRRERITHILFHEPRSEEYIGQGIFDWGEEAQKRFQAFLWQYGKLAFQAERVFLFELADLPLPKSSMKTGTLLCFLPQVTIKRARELTERINGLIQQDRTAESLSSAQELVRTVPGMPQAWSFLAYAQAARQNMGEAMNDYAESIRVGYPPTACYFNLGLIYERMGRPDDAIAVYEKGLRVESVSDQMKERCAELAYVRGKFAVAARLFSELAATFPDNPIYAARILDLKTKTGTRM